MPQIPAERRGEKEQAETSSTACLLSLREPQPFHSMTYRMLLCPAEILKPT